MKTHILTFLGILSISLVSGQKILKIDSIQQGPWAIETFTQVFSYSDSSLIENLEPLGDTWSWEDLNTFDPNLKRKYYAKLSIHNNTDWDLKLYLHLFFKHVEMISNTNDHDQKEIGTSVKKSDQPDHLEPGLKSIKTFELEIPSSDTVEFTFIITPGLSETFGTIIRKNGMLYSYASLERIYHYDLRFNFLTYGMILFAIALHLSIWAFQKEKLYLLYFSGYALAFILLFALYEGDLLFLFEEFPTTYFHVMDRVLCFMLFGFWIRFSRYYLKIKTLKRPIARVNFSISVVLGLYALFSLLLLQMLPDWYIKNFEYHQTGFFLLLMLVALSSIFLGVFAFINQVETSRVYVIATIALWLGALPYILKGICGWSFGSSYPIQPVELGFILQILLFTAGFAKRHTELDNNDEIYNGIIKNTISERHIANQKAIANQESAKNKKLEEKLSEIVLDSIKNGETILIPILAEKADLTPDQLFKFIKKEFKITPKEWVDGIRFHKAQKLLSHSKCPISDVAFLCGFKHSQFSNRFKEKFGMAPTEYRIKHG